MFNQLSDTAKTDHIANKYGRFLNSDDKKVYITNMSRLINEYTSRLSSNPHLAPSIVSPVYRKMMIAMIDYFP